MKITTAATAPSGIAAAYKNAPAPQKAAQVSPAYAIDLSQRARRWQDTQHIRHIQETTTVASNLKEIPYDEGLSSVQKGIAAAQQKIRDDLGENNVGPVSSDRPLESVPTSYSDGIESALMAITVERDIAPDIGKVFHPLYQEVQEHFDAYKNANKTLSRGSLEDFRAFNLKLAGIAKAGLDETEGDRASYHISMGDYTAEEVSRATGFAKTLQKSAGVFVVADFQNYNVEYATGIGFSYNGTLAKVGIKTLSFMADHKEAMDVWTKAVQGKYVDERAVKEALDEAGLKDTATAYEDMLKDSNPGIEDKLSYTFDHKAGELWTALAGYNKPKEAERVYRALQEKMRGSDTSSLTYQSYELEESTAGGHSEKRFLENLISSRPPSILVQDKNGEYHLLPPGQENFFAGESENDTATDSNPKSYADAAIKRLQEKIADIREQNLPLEEKQKQINAIKQQILTYQNMKLQDQKRDTAQSH